MRYALLLALSLAWFLPPAVAQADVGTSGPTGIMLAAKKKKKTKKKQSDEEGFGVDGLAPVTDDSGTGVHRDQEGVDTPYKAEASMGVNVSLLSSKQGDADAVDQTVLDINIEWLALVGSFGIGPDIGYGSSSSSSNQEVADGVTGKTKSEKVEDKSTSYRVGGVFKFYFANVDKADLVPFAYVGVAYLGQEDKYGDAKAAKSSGFGIRVGGGLNLFLDSNIAFNPRLEYLQTSVKSDGDPAVETKSDGFKILVGLAVFI